MKYLLTLLLVGCATPTFKAAVISLPAEHYPMEEHSARTVCAMNGVPIIIINPKVVGTIAEPLTLAHEEVHVRQLHFYKGGCFKAMEAYMTDSTIRIRWESEAYCATIDKAVSMGIDPIRFLAVVKEAVRREFNTELSCSTQGNAQELLGIGRGG